MKNFLLVVALTLFAAIMGAVLAEIFDRPKPRLRAVETVSRQAYNAQGQPVDAPRHFKREIRHRYRIILSLP